MQTRRDFLKTSGQMAFSVAALGTAADRVFAAGSDTVRVGLIGCGGRGTGAAKDCLESSQGIQIVAVADPFSDRMEGAVNEMKKWCQDKQRPVDQIVKVTPDRMFGGYDGYRKVLALNDVDMVILGTPPVFRPVQFEAAIKAGKHVFMEKPVAVDPPGARKVMEAGDLAKQKGLAVVAGTQRRYQKIYRENAYAVSHGAIGRILGGRIWWCGGALWFSQRQANQSDADYMVRNWVSFAEMSGDHIVEQHVHNIDVANWLIGRPPKMALGFGGRARRKTGDQYDFFSIDYDYGDDVTIHSMCRQVNGTYGRVSEHFVGTEGNLWGDGKPQGKSVTVPAFEDGNPYVIEHRELVRSIREGKPLNDARQVAESTLAAIMGRISTYTGQMVKWPDLMENKDSPLYNLQLAPTPQDFEQGTVKAPKEDVVPIPGKD